MSDTLTLEDLSVISNLIREINATLGSHDGRYQTLHPGRVWAVVADLYRRAGCDVGERTDAIGATICYVIVPRQRQR